MHEVHSIAISYTVQQGLSDVRHRGLQLDTTPFNGDAAAEGSAHRAVRSDTPASHSQLPWAPKEGGGRGQSGAAPSWNLRIMTLYAASVQNIRNFSLVPSALG